MVREDIRILEVGEFALFKRVLPGTTTLLHAGARADRAAGCADYSALVCRDLTSVRRAIEAGNFDMVAIHATGGGVWGIWPRAALTWWLLRILRRSGGRRPRVVALDFHDAHIIHPTNRALLKACRLYFKRELPADLQKAFRPWGAVGVRRLLVSCPDAMDRIRPIPLGISDDALRAMPADARSKTADVFFAGDVRDSAVRRQGLVELAALADEGLRLDLPTGRLPRSEYYERCARAWLTWSPSGKGWQCFRHGEAPLCRSVPVIDRSPLREHAPLMEGEHCFYYSPQPGVLRSTIIGALQNKERLGRMAEAARGHVLGTRTHRVIAGHVLATMAPVSAAEVCLDGPAGIRLDGSIARD